VQDRKWQITLRGIMVGIAVIAAILAVVVAAQRNGPVGYFFWLASQSVEVGLGLLPIPALFAVTGLIVAAIAAIRNPAPLKGKWVWLLLPFVVPAGILAYGVAFNYSGPLGSLRPGEVRRSKFSCGSMSPSASSCWSSRERTPLFLLDCRFSNGGHPAARRS
jgi:hypothetical protein